ncbi:MAG: hypothetical protein WC455_31280 [Dehalococcoidia bacterium]|jgi:tartrate dehydratase beta subunit/fumarate hydratase class I family protein
MNESEWLASLKPGDTVAVSGGLGGRDMWLAKVHRKTASGRIIIQSKNAHATFETTYNPDGSERGGQEYYREQLHEPTQEIRDRIEKERLVSKIRHVSWHEMPLEMLRKIEEMTDP